MLLRQSIRRQLPRPWATLARQQLQPFSSRRTPLPRHPAYENLAESLQQLPHFRTRAEDVRVLNEPAQFYQTLIVSPPGLLQNDLAAPFPPAATCCRLLTFGLLSLSPQERISQAKRRIFIASLYIGKEETELVSRSPSQLEMLHADRFTLLHDGPDRSAALGTQAEPLSRTHLCCRLPALHPRDPQTHLCLSHRFPRRRFPEPSRPSPLPHAQPRRMEEAVDSKAI